MKFADKLELIKRRKEWQIAFDQVCKTCGSDTHCVKDDKGKVTADCCEEPEFEVDWSCGFTLRDMDTALRDEFDLDAKKRVKYKGIRPDMNTLNNQGQTALVIAMTMVNDETKQLQWDYKDKQALASIDKITSSISEVLKDTALALCGLSSEAKEEAAKKLLQADQTSTGSE
jgi:hypothetical protein